jgi:DNA primase
MTIAAELDFRRLKRLVSIERVLAHYGLLAKLTRRSDRLVGPCPLHGGDNPGAFVVSQANNLWHCFTGCAAGGDVVDLICRLQQCDHRRAAHYLAALAATAPVRPLPQPRPPARPRRFRPYTKRLPLDPNAGFLRDKGIGPAIASRFEVGAYHGRGMLAGCVAIRLHSSQGHVLGYAGRRLDPQHVAGRGKWTFPPGLPKSKLLYGYHQSWPLLQRRGVVLVECPWGVLRLAQLRVPAVALLGTGLSQAQRELLRALPRVVIMMDGDPAGTSAAASLRRRLPNSVVFELPEGNDPDDLADSQLLRVTQLLPF